jgi:hypothetical protein
VVDQALRDVGGLGAAGAAEGVDGNLVGEHARTVMAMAWNR